MKTLVLLAILAQAMPDPKAMSGQPLPVPDLAAGSVTARVIRGQLSNPLPGQTVELSGAGDIKKSTTDESGRATFTGITPGSRVKLAVVVGTERIESQEFPIAASGGTRVMLVATDPETEKRAAEDRKLAAGPVVQGSVVLGDESRFVLEVNDDSINVFNIMQILNTSRTPVDPGAPLVFELPRTALGAGMMQGSTPNAVAAGNRVTVTGPFAPGNTMVQFAYSMALGSETITIEQKMPVAMTQISVVAQKLGNSQLASPQVTQKREMTAEGGTYLVGQGGAVKAGDTVSIVLSGLPSRAAWPRNMTLLIAAIIIGTGVWSATRKEPPARGVTSRQSLQTRRDRLFGELAALEAQKRKGAVDADTYASRRESLVTALEDLYRGLDREVA